MKKIIKIIFSALLAITGMISISACDSLIENGNIDKFVGRYTSNTGTETVKHYYWGNTTIKSETQFMQSGINYLIYPNKKVLYKYSGSETISEGRVRVFTDYVMFSGVSINESYKFYLKDDHSLYYSYHEDKYGLEYDYVTRSASLTYRGEIDEDDPFDEKVDSGYINIERKQEEYETLDKNYVFRGVKAHYKVTGKDGDGNDIDSDSANVRWFIADTNIARVDENGTVNPLKAGTFILQATLGNYIDRIEINSAVIATKFELDELQNEYRQGYSYPVPISFSPYDASITYTSSDPFIARISDDKKYISILSDGNVTISAEAFTNINGEKTTLDININAVNEKAPRFDYDGWTRTSATITIAKNQYSRIEPAKLGISAYTYNGDEITDQITIDSGDYNLFEVGTYDVVLKATDRFYSSYFYLTLVVEEYETLKIDASTVEDGLIVVRKGYRFVEKPASQAIKEIIFEADVKLNDYYDAADINIIWYIRFKMKHWDDNYWSDHTVNSVIVKEYSLAKNEPRNMYLEFKYTDSHDLIPDSFTGFEMYAYGKGTYYKYIYY